MAVYKFNDVFEDATKKGKKIPTNQYLLEGKYPIIDQGKEDIGGYTNTENGLFTNVPAIIFGDHTRIIKYVDMPFFIGADGVKILEKKVAEADYKYLFYTLNHAYIPDTGYNRHFKFLKEISITIPDIVEQRKIVQQLDLLSSMIDKQLSVLEIYDNLVKSRFVEMFGDLRINPCGWKIQSFADLTDLITDGEHATPRRVPKGIYLLSARNVLNHSIQLDDVDYIDEEEYKRIAKRVVPKEGDVLISCSGSVGRCCSVPAGLKFQMVRSAALLRFKSFINPVFAEYMITSDYLQGQINSAKTASSQANLFQGRIAKLKGFAPPIDLQKKFADFVAHADKSKLAVQQSIETLQMLKAKLMQDYFG